MKMPQAIFAGLPLIALALCAAGLSGRGARRLARSRANNALEAYQMTEGLAWAELEEALDAKLEWVTAHGSDGILPADLHGRCERALAAWQEILQWRDLPVRNRARGNKQVAQ